MALKENYKDDILDVSVNTKRKYRMTENADGTISLDDETEYLQEGDNFGSGDINATNGKVNTLDSAVTTLNANLDGFKFYPTGTGIVGLIADDSAYTDEDGNYVVWGTATANQLVEDNPNTYKSVPSEEDCRGEEGADTAIPFSGKVEEDLLFFSMYEQQQSGGDLFIDQRLYAPNDNADALFVDNGWSGNNWKKTLTFTALKSKKIRLKGNYWFNKWQTGYNCYVEIKHNNTSLTRYDSTVRETKTFDVDVEVNLQVGDTLTFHRDQVFFTWNGVLSIS